MRQMLPGAPPRRARRGVYRRPRRRACGGCFPRKASDGVFGATRRRGSGVRGGAPRGGDGALARRVRRPQPPTRLRGGEISRHRRARRRNATRVRLGAGKSPVPKTRSCFRTVERALDDSAPECESNAKRQKEKQKTRAPATSRSRAWRRPPSGRSARALRSPFASRSQNMKRVNATRYATDSEHDPLDAILAFAVDSAGTSSSAWALWCAREAASASPRLAARCAARPGLAPPARARRRRAATPARSPPGLPGSA